MPPRGKPGGEGPAERAQLSLLAQVERATCHRKGVFVLTMDARQRPWEEGHSAAALGLDVPRGPGAGPGVAPSLLANLACPGAA